MICLLVSTIFVSLLTRGNLTKNCWECLQIHWIAPCGTRTFFLKHELATSPHCVASTPKMGVPYPALQLKEQYTSNHEIYDWVYHTTNAHIFRTRVVASRVTLFSSGRGQCWRFTAPERALSGKHRPSEFMEDTYMLVRETILVFKWFKCI